MEVKAAAAHILISYEIPNQAKWKVSAAPQMGKYIWAEMSPKDAIVQLIPISNN